MRRYVDHPGFNRLVDRLYGAFAGRAPEGRVVRWIDMVRPEFEAKCAAEVSRRAVWELSDDVYREVAWHAFCWDFDHRPTAWYFLPRMIDAEVAARVMPWPFALEERADAIAADLDMIAERLAGLRWREWPAEQREAIENVFVGLWRWQLAQPRSAYPVESTTSMLIVMGLELAWVLREWLGEGTAGAVSVARFVLNHPIDAVSGTIGRWRATGLVQREVLGWLVSREVTDALERAFFVVGSDEERSVLSLVVEVVEALRRARCVW